MTCFFVCKTTQINLVKLYASAGMYTIDLRIRSHSTILLRLFVFVFHNTSSVKNYLETAIQSSFD